MCSRNATCRLARVSQLQSLGHLRQPTANSKKAHSAKVFPLPVCPFAMLSRIQKALLDFGRPNRCFLIFWYRELRGMPGRLAAFSTFPCSFCSTCSMWSISSSKRARGIRAGTVQSHKIDERRLGKPEAAFMSEHDLLAQGICLNENGQKVRFDRLILFS